MDRIRLAGLRYFTHVGCTAEERRVGQYLDLDLDMGLDLLEAGREDALEKSVDYARAAQVVEEAIGGYESKLLETIAQRAAEAVLALGVTEVTVRVRKPTPPMPQGYAEFAEVEITRRRT